NRSIEDERMEWKVLSDQEDERGPNMVEGKDKIERSSMLQEGNSKTQLNDGCVRNRLGSDAGGNLESTGANLCVGDMEWNSESQFLQLMRIECCTDEDDVTIIEESEKISNTIRNQSPNGAYSGNTDSNNRQLEQDGNQRRLLIGSTSTVESVPKASDLPNDRWLRESNQQVTKKLLQLVAAQQRRRTGCVPSELGQRMFISAPSYQNDIENSQENFGGQSNSIGNTTQFERTNLERIIEAVISEQDEIGQSGDNSESGSSNDSESIETASRGATCCKDDRHELGE
ncbi:MAG: hypothetical protein EZS28_021953, partial [Streblomastix strix]